MEPAGQGTLRCTKEGAWNQTKPSCKGKSSQSPAGQTTANFSLWNDDVCTGSELQEHLLNGFEPFQSTNRFHEEYIHYKVHWVESVKTESGDGHMPCWCCMCFCIWIEQTLLIDLACWHPEINLCPANIPSPNSLNWGTVQGTGYRSGLLRIEIMPEGDH